MKSGKILPGLVVAAILPALAVSIGIILLAPVVGMPTNIADRVAQVLFFAVFLLVYNVKRRRLGAQV